MLESNGVAIYNLFLEFKNYVTATKPKQKSITEKNLVTRLCNTVLVRC